MARLAALVPRPRQKTQRYHGVYAPNARLRSRVVVEPSQRGRQPCSCGPQVPSPETNRLCWAELIKRVILADVFACPRCNFKMSRIAWITDPGTIKKILKSVGLPTDSPAGHPARSAEELLGTVA